MTFEVGKTYPSDVDGRKYRVTMKFRVQDTDCLLVHRDSPDILFGRTSLYYPAMIADDGKRATVLLNTLLYTGFTTIIYDEEVEV